MAMQGWAGPLPAVLVERASMEVGVMAAVQTAGGLVEATAMVAGATEEATTTEAQRV